MLTSREKENALFKQIKPYAWLKASHLRAFLSRLRRLEKRVRAIESYIGIDDDGA